MAKMNAVRFHGQKDVRVEQIEIPKCGKGQVKVRGFFQYPGPFAIASKRLEMDRGAKSEAFFD